MAKIYYENDANIALLKGKTIAVLGYGNQGQAQAQNLKDSGLAVVVGQRPGGPNYQKAVNDGMTVLSVAEACQKADFIQLLLPDEAQAAIYQNEIKPYLRPDAVIGFAHGFNINFGQIVPPPDVDVVMIAPKGPGHLLRRLYLQGSCIPGLVAVAQDASGKAHELALAYAKGIGCTRAGVIQTTFKEETETDLFGEQVVLCGGLTHLIRAGFETLVDAGYQPEVAYFECLHEVKLIADLIYEDGVSKMRDAISDTAEWGDLISGPRIINGQTKAEMQQILAEIQDGSFAKNWILEDLSGRPVFKARAKADEKHQIEQVGRQLRSMMPWIHNNNK